MWKNFTDRIRNTDVHGVFIKPKTYACICSLNDVMGGSVIWWSSPNCRQTLDSGSRLLNSLQVKPLGMMLALPV